MIRFLIKGILRDRSRSILPVLIVAAGVALTVFMVSWVQGAYDEIIEVNAHFNSGHVKIMSKGFARDENLLPNDLALGNADSLISYLKTNFPQMVWRPRIRFGGLLDVPDEKGETRAQGPVFGLGLDLREKGEYSEQKLFNLNEALVRGRLPRAKGEILVSQKYAEKLKIKPGNKITLIGSTMYGGMAIYNFTIVGTVRFGMSLLDRGTMIADLRDIQQALEMDDAVGEILGFFASGQYDEKQAIEIKNQFNKKFNGTDDLTPQMKTLSDQPMLKELLAVGKVAWGIVLAIFLVAMSIVLWNSGLMAGLRRYGEVGIRLAMGETKGHIYRSMLTESFFIALVGSVIGTGIGLVFSYYLQYKGLDMGSLLKSSSMLMSNVMHARVSPLSWIIGFIPGILATFIGTALSGIGIYRRQTAQLFKELEV